MQTTNIPIIKLVAMHGKEWLESEHKRITRSFADYSPPADHIVELCYYGNFVQTTLGELGNTVMAFQAYKDLGGSHTMGTYSAELFETAKIYEQLGKPHARTLEAAEHFKKLTDIILAYEALDPNETT